MRYSKLNDVQRALDDEQSRLPPGCDIGRIFAVPGETSGNWSAVAGARGVVPLTPGLDAITRVQAQHPFIEPDDLADLAHDE